MARTKRRIRDRGRKSQKRKKPIRTRRRRRGSVKRRRTKRGTKNMKGGAITHCPEYKRGRFHVQAGETLDHNTSYLAHRCKKYGRKGSPVSNPCSATLDPDATYFCDLYSALQKERYGYG